jgi:hypothetical protein
LQQQILFASFGFSEVLFFNMAVTAIMFLGSWQYRPPVRSSSYLNQLITLFQRVAAGNRRSAFHFARSSVLPKLTRRHGILKSSLF